MSEKDKYTIQTVSVCENQLSDLLEEILFASPLVADTPQPCAGSTSSL